MKALVDFDPVSIDAFLRDHPAYSKAGKIMIVYSLLKHENKSAFTFNHEEKDNWYSFFSMTYYLVVISLKILQRIS